MNDALQAAPRAAPPGSAPWFALLFTPEPRRPPAAALLELRAEILDSVRRPSEPEVALARLQWWRAEITAFGSGAAQHPALRRLRDADAGRVIQPEYLAELVDAARTELLESPCLNYAELSLYCYRSSGVLHEMLAALFGCQDKGNERAVYRYAQRLGTGIRLAEIITGLPTDLAAGRRLLPRDWIEETGADEASAAQRRIDPALSSCLDRLAGEARLALDEAESVLPGTERSRQRTGLVLAALHRRGLAKLHARGFDATALPGHLESLWTAWRAARRASEDPR